MRILLVDAYRPDDPDRHVVDAIADRLRGFGHNLDVHSLVADGFEPFMSAAERRAYVTDDPLVSEDTKRAAAAIKAADALVFCHPTSLFGVPPAVKGWLDRVMVMGVGFEFAPSGRVRPGMRNIKRIGVVTTTPHSRRRTLRARDLTHRTLGRTLWLSCSRRCRRTFVRLPTGADPAAALAAVESSFKRWR